MAEVWTMGELLCEIMRPEVDMPLDVPGTFLGPYPSGAPANFIDTVARLGHSAGIVGGIGNDDFGKCILNRLKKSGVDCSLITKYDNGTTGVAFVTYFADGSRRFIFHFPDTPATRPNAPDADRLGSDVRWFHIMGCSLMANARFGREIVGLAKTLAAQGVKISFDPNFRPELVKDNFNIVLEVMECCNVLFPGVAELLAISKCDSVEDAVKSCFMNPRMEIIALKEGEKGATVYTRDSKISLGVYPVEVKDPTGAGDCFDGAFICGLLEGKTLLETAKSATAAAALNTAAFGPMEGDISTDTINKMIMENKLCYK